MFTKLPVQGANQISSITEGIESMNSVEKLQVLLVFPRDSEEYKLARQKFLKIKKFEKPDDQTVNIHNHLIMLMNHKGLLALPLKGSQLDKIPNLLDAKIETFQYAYCVKFLHSLAKEKQLNSGMVIAHLKSMLPQQKKFSDRIILIVTSILLQNYYDLDSIKDLDHINRVIRAFLSKTDIELKLSEMPEAIPQDLLMPLSSLRFFLHHSNQELRLQARSITEALRLPLELHQMLSLSIDGVQRSSKQMDDAALVVGVSGCGKSTLINYMVGVKHDCIRDQRTRKTYLQPKPGQKVPANVGHSSTSETLYPLLVHGEVTFKESRVIQEGEETEEEETEELEELKTETTERVVCIDTPGFEDNRGEEEATCAALGVPLATRYTENIRALVVVIEWGMVEPNSRDRVKTFRLLAQTLGKIIKEPETLFKVKDLNSPVPLVFAVSKPPRPERGEFFDAEELRRQFKNSIEEIKRSRRGVYASLDAKKKKRALLKKDIDELQLCLGEVGGFVDVDKVEQDISGVSKASWAKFIAARLVGEKVIDEGERESAIAQQKQQWKSAEMPQGCVDRLELVLRKNLIALAEKSSGEKVIESYRQDWEKEKTKLEKDCDSLSKQIEEIESEQVMLNLMTQYSDNVFIIRGYQDAEEDGPDHRDELLGYLKQLREKEIFISQNDFRFDATSSDFAKVRCWAEDSSEEIYRILNGLLSVPHKIAEIDKGVLSLEVEMTNKQSRLSSELMAKPAEVQDALVESIAFKEERIRDCEKEISELKRQKAPKQREINDINSRDAIEYGGDFKKEERSSWFWGAWGRTIWTYDFPGRQPKQTSGNQNRGFLDILTGHYPDGFDIIPIERISKICKGGGYFQVKQDERPKGKYTATYYSKVGEAGDVSVTTFVLPKNIPANKRQIETLTEEIAALTSLMKDTKEELDCLKKELGADKEQLEQMKRGLYNQEQKVASIKVLLRELGYTREVFLERFFSAVRGHITWLVEPSHFKVVLEFLNCTKEQATQRLGFDKQLLLGFIRGKRQENPSGLELSDFMFDQYLQEVKVPAQFFKDMYSITNETGLTLESLVEIIRTLDVGVSGVPTLPKKLMVQKVNRAREQYLFESLKTLYLSFHLRIRTLDQVIGLLEFSNNPNITGYLSSVRKMEAAGAINYSYPEVESEILKEVTNSLFGNVNLVDTWEKCHERYGISIDYLRFRSGQTRLDDNLRGGVTEILAQTGIGLYDAVRRGDKPSCITVLQSFLELNSHALPVTCDPDKVQEPLLFTLAQFGRVDWLEDESIQQCLKWDIADQQGNMVLHQAAAYGQHEFGSTLIRKGILESKIKGQYIWPKNKLGQTPFHVAAIKGQVGLMIKWAEQYTAPDELLCLTSNGDSVLHLLVRHRQTEALVTLLEKYSYLSVRGLNVHRQDPLYLAIANQDEKTTIQLLKHPVDLANRDLYGRTVLHEAVRRNLLLIVEKLLEKGADFRITDHDGKTPDAYAVPHSKIDVYFSNHKLQGRAVQHLEIAKPQWRNLVFQGGGVKGFVYSSALRTLVDEKLCSLEQFTRVAGTSAGAITALLIGLGYDLDEIDHIIGVKILQNSDLPQLKFEEFLDGEWGEKLVAANSGNLEKLLGTEHHAVLQRLKGIDGVLVGIARVLDGTVYEAARATTQVFQKVQQAYKHLNQDFGFCPGEKLLSLFEQFIVRKLLMKAKGESGNFANITFEELSKYDGFRDMYFVGVNTVTGEPEVFSRETTPHMVISNAVRISMSIPGVFKPCPKIVKRDGQLQASTELYVDGGLLWNYPIDIFDFERYLDKKATEPDSRRINSETLGLRLVSSRLKTHYEQGERLKGEDITTFWKHLQSVAMTLVGSEEKNHARQGNQFRTIYIDTLNVGTLDFERIDEITVKKALVEQGRQGVLTFKSRMRLSDSSYIKLPDELNQVCLKYAEVTEMVGNSQRQTTQLSITKYRPHPELVLAFYSYPDPRIQQLLHQGFGVLLWSRDEKGNTAFHIAAQNNQIQALERLLKAAPDGAVATNYEEKTPSSLTQDKGILALLTRYSLLSSLEIKTDDSLLYQTSSSEMVTALSVINSKFSANSQSVINTATVPQAQISEDRASKTLLLSYASSPIASTSTTSPPPNIQRTESVEILRKLENLFMDGDHEDVSKIENFERCNEVLKPRNARLRYDKGTKKHALYFDSALMNTDQAIEKLSFLAAAAKSRPPSPTT